MPVHNRSSVICRKRSLREVNMRNRHSGHDRDIIGEEKRWNLMSTTLSSFDATLDGVLRDHVRDPGRSRGGSGITILETCRI